MSSWCNSYVHNPPLIIHDNSRLNAVYNRLNSSHENGTDGILRIKKAIDKAIDVDHNKRVISDQTSELDDAFQQFSVSRPV